MHKMHKYLLTYRDAITGDDKIHQIIYSEKKLNLEVMCSEEDKNYGFESRVLEKEKKMFVGR